jgi:hypothetical protein
LHGAKLAADARGVACDASCRALYRIHLTGNREKRNNKCVTKDRLQYICLLRQSSYIYCYQHRTELHKI